ncbi:glycosyltransferase, partial [Staphylococcus aureus]|nr:glycosyltransferase [Staphylococcus aureus]
KGIQVFLHKVNRGKGAAVRTGLDHATGDILFLQDSDLEYDPKDIASLIQPILDKKTEVVFSSRRMNKNNSYSSKLYKWGGAFVDGIISLA